MVVKDTKIYNNMKNKSYLSIEKNIIKSEKTPYYNYKKLFHLEDLVFFKALANLRNFFWYFLNNSLLRINEQSSRVTRNALFYA